MAHTDRKDACNRKLHPDVRDARPFRRFDAEGRDIYDTPTLDILAYLDGLDRAADARNAQGA